MLEQKKLLEIGKLLGKFIILILLLNFDYFNKILNLLFIIFLKLS